MDDSADNELLHKNLLSNPEMRGYTSVGPCKRDRTRRKAVASLKLIPVAREAAKNTDRRLKTSARTVCTAAPSAASAAARSWSQNRTHSRRPPPRKKWIAWLRLPCHAGHGLLSAPRERKSICCRHPVTASLETPSSLSYSGNAIRTMSPSSSRQLCNSQESNIKR